MNGFISSANLNFITVTYVNIVSKELNIISKTYIIGLYISIFKHLLSDNNNISYQLVGSGRRLIIQTPIPLPDSNNSVIYYLIYIIEI